MPEYIRKYNKEGADLVEIDNKKLSNYNIKIIQRNMSSIKDGRVRHNPEVIAATIIEMICNDLKFHDMQNNTEYLLLQSVLKEQKKLIAQNEKRLVKVSNKPSLKKKKTHDTKKKSKFNEKYMDRVSSIKNTEKKIAENRKIAKEIEKMENVKKESLNKNRKKQ